MSANLTPVTLDLPDELIAELTLAAQAKGLTLEEWVTILVKKAISELPDDSTPQTSESQALESKDGAPFNAEAFESEFIEAQAQRPQHITETNQISNRWLEKLSGPKPL